MGTGRQGSWQRPKPQLLESIWLLGDCENSLAPDIIGKARPKTGEGNNSPHWQIGRASGTPILLYSETNSS
jgi:hypothetical protein